MRAWRLYLRALCIARRAAERAAPDEASRMFVAAFHTAIESGRRWWAA